MKVCNVKTLIGLGASNRVAVEQIHYLQELDLTIKKIKNCNPEVELKRFNDTRDAVIKKLQYVYEKTKEHSESSAQVFEIHQMMLEDLDYTESVEALINKKYNAEYAVSQTGVKFRQLFESSESEVLQSRSMDVLDITNRMIREFKGIKEDVTAPKGRFILISKDLLPSDIVKFNYNQIAGFVTQYGSKNAHAAILARTLDIPIVVNLGDRFEEIPQYGMMAINGATGEIVINPNQYILDIYKKKIGKEIELSQSLEKYRNKKAISKDGHTVIIGANIGSVLDVDLVLANDADAVGLFRSEFIYLESKDYPTEEFQFEIYKEVLSKLKDKQVIIRTLDIGADKTAPYFKLAKEENPALGYRAVRICLKQPEIFKTQLRALYRASVFGNLALMFPMITHVEQVLEIKKMIEEVKVELDKEKHEYSEKVSIGVMIETPAAVMISDLLAKHVDFFSIGTNDLTQYTLAVDRMNTEIEDLFDSSHESILRMIELTTKNAHQEGIWVGICGESASELSLIDFYLKIKIDELSVSPSKVLQLKKSIIEA